MDSKLKRAVNEIFDFHSDCLNYENRLFNETSVEIDDKSVAFLLNNIRRNDEGRLVMPLLWNHKVAHLLGKNQSLKKF